MDDDEAVGGTGCARVSLPHHLDEVAGRHLDIDIPLLSGTVSLTGATDDRFSSPHHHGQRVSCASPRRRPGQSQGTEGIVLSNFGESFLFLPPRARPSTPPPLDGENNYDGVGGETQRNKTNGA